MEPGAEMEGLHRGSGSRASILCPSSPALSSQSLGAGAQGGQGWGGGFRVRDRKVLESQQACALESKSDNSSTGNRDRRHLLSTYCLFFKQALIN